MSNDDHRNNRHEKAQFTHDIGYTDETFGESTWTPGPKKIPKGRESTMSNSEQIWMKGGNRLIGLNRLFGAKKDDEDKAEQKAIVHQEVPRCFNFPLKGEAVEADDVVGLHNIVTDFREVVRSDQRDDHELFRQFITDIITHRYFNWFFTAGIIMNPFVMLAEIILSSHPMMLAEYKVHITLLNNIFLSIFLIELLLKYYGTVETFWLDAWNVMDFCLIGVCLCDSNTEWFTNSQGNVLSVLRTFRILRVLKSITRLTDYIPGLPMVMKTLVETTEQLAYIMLIWFFTSVVLCVLGCSFFEETHYMRKHFSDFAEGMWTNFIILTQDGWRLKYQDGFREYYDETKQPNMEQRSSNFLVWYLLTFFTVVFSGLVLNSMCVASVVSNLDKAMIDEAQDRDGEEDDDTDMIGTTLADDFDDEEKAEIKSNIKNKDADITFMTNHPAFIKLSQRPFFKCSDGKKNVERVEDKLLILHALETNLKEYNQLRSELDAIQEEIKTLNDPTTTNEDAMRILTCSKTPNNNLNTGMFTGLRPAGVRASNISQLGPRTEKRSVAAKNKI